MKNSIIERTLLEANYMIKTKKTIREIAKKFNVSKSTVHKDLKERLKEIDINKHREVSEILKEHLEIRHHRGGEATRKKYNKLK